jgi:maltose-binding protein MalE
MTRCEVSRRAMLLGSVSTLAAALTSRSALAQQTTRLRMFWWGSKERADRTFKANELYIAKNPDIKIDGETIGWADYWPRMATQAAGRNLPDVIQMDYRYIFEYARRSALLPLNDLMPKVLDIADFGESSINSGAVDGKLYGINLGNNSTAMIVAAETYKQAGVKPPSSPRRLGRTGSMAPRTPAVWNPLSRCSCVSAARPSMPPTASSASPPTTRRSGSPIGTRCARRKPARQPICKPLIR